MKLKKGQIVDIFTNYKEQEGFVGKGVLLIKNNKKAILPPMSFVSDEETNKKEKINNYLLTTPVFEGESDGVDYKVKPIKEKYNVYSFEYWLVEFITGDTYPINFRKWMKIRITIGSYSTLKELSALTISSENEAMLEKEYNEDE
mgnify:CR=1 FL=1|tara:strand:+ start:1284 stop:1718 length:435 start_codon:yes stop_codon:yes gene_type:complete